MPEPHTGRLQARCRFPDQGLQSHLRIHGNAILVRKARAGYHPLAADDAPLQLKRPCRICQVARYAAIFAAIIIWYATVREPIGSETALPTALQRAKPVPIGSRALPDFSLTSHHGNRFGKSDLQDTWTVITIGYRACATDCPQTLAAMADARQSLLGFNASTPAR